MLNRLAEVVAEARSLEDLTRPLLELIEAATGFDSVYLTSIDRENSKQYILFSRNNQRMHIPEGLEVPWQETLCRRALDEDRFAVDDVPAVWPDSAAARALGIRSYVTTPVNAAGELYGTLCAASSRHLQVSAETQALIRMFAALIGQQIEREALMANLQRAHVEVNAQAMTDPLTGLANRRALMVELNRAVSLARRTGGTLHALFIDLDGFKQINDQHGHDVGDAFLRAVAERLRGALRDDDYAARYGGDEFVVLATSADSGHAERIRERMEAAIAGRYELDGVMLEYPGASIGIATAMADEGADALLARADEAMYVVKRARRAASGR